MLFPFRGVLHEHEVQGGTGQVSTFVANKAFKVQSIMPVVLMCLDFVESCSGHKISNSYSRIGSDLIISHMFELI